MIRETVRRHLLAMTSEVITKIIEGALDSRAGVPVEKFNRLEDQVHRLGQVLAEMAPPGPGFVLTASSTKRIAWGNGDLFVNVCRNDDGRTWTVFISQAEPGGSSRVVRPIPLEFQRVDLHKLRRMLMEIETHVDRGCIPAWISNPNQGAGRADREGTDGP